jgi:hypothetical protein
VLTTDCQVASYQTDSVWTVLWSDFSLETCSNIACGSDNTLYFLADNQMQKVKLPSQEAFTVNGENLIVIKVGKNGKPIAINSVGSLYWPDENCSETEEPEFELTGLCEWPFCDGYEYTLLLEPTDARTAF